MSYELILVENGDVLGVFGDRDAAIDHFLEYVERSRAAHPGIEELIAVVGLEDEGRSQREVIPYQRAVEAHRAALT